MKSYVKEERMDVVRLADPDGFCQAKALFDRADTPMTLVRTAEGVFVEWDDVRVGVEDDYTGKSLTHCVSVRSGGKWREPFFCPDDFLFDALRDWEESGSSLLGMSECPDCRVAVATAATECPFCGRSL